MNSKAILWGSLGIGAAAIIYYLVTKQPATTQTTTLLPTGGSNLVPNQVQPSPAVDSVGQTLNTIKAVAGVGQLAAEALSTVGDALGIGGAAAGTILNTSAAVTPTVIGSSIESAALATGATASEAASAGAAAAQTAGTSLASGASVTEASTAASITAGSIIGTAAAVLLPIALVAVAFEVFATDDHNTAANLEKVNEQDAIAEMPKYSVYGSGGTGTSQDPNANPNSSLTTQTGTRFTPGFQGLGSLTAGRIIRGGKVLNPVQKQAYLKAVQSILRKAA